MKLCSPDCPPVCDFCIWYNFNGDHNGSFIDDGYCRLNGQVRWPEDICDLFICGNWQGSENACECSMDEYMDDPCPEVRTIRMTFRNGGWGKPRFRFKGFEEEL